MGWMASLVISFMLFAFCCCTGGSSFNTKLRVPSTRVSVWRLNGAEGAEVARDEGTLMSSAGSHFLGKKEEAGLEQYITLLNGRSQADGRRNKGIVLTPGDAAKTMRALVNEVLRADQSRLLRGPLYEADGFRNLASSLTMHVSDMNHVETSNVMWGFGTLMKRGDNAMVYKKESRSVLGINYRVDKTSFLAFESESGRNGGESNDELLDLINVSLLRFSVHVAAAAAAVDRVDRPPGGAKVPEGVHVSKLIVGIGRVAKSAGLTFNDLSDSSKQAFLCIVRHSCQQGLLLGASGQPLSNTLWALAQMKANFWTDLTPDLRSSVMAVVYKECKEDADFTDQALASTLLSFSKMEIQWEQVPLAVQSALSTALCRVCLRSGEKEIAAQAIGNILYALGSMGTARLQLTDRVAVAIEIAIRRICRRNDFKNDDANRPLEPYSYITKENEIPDPEHSERKRSYKVLTNPRPSKVKPDSLKQKKLKIKPIYTIEKSPPRLYSKKK